MLHRACLSAGFQHLNAIQRLCQCLPAASWMPAKFRVSHRVHIGAGVPDCSAGFSTIPNRYGTYQLHRDPFCWLARQPVASCTDCRLLSFLQRVGPQRAAKVQAAKVLRESSLDLQGDIDDDGSYALMYTSSQVCISTLLLMPKAVTHSFDLRTVCLASIRTHHMKSITYFQCQTRLCRGARSIGVAAAAVTCAQMCRPAAGNGPKRRSRPSSTPSRTRTHAVAP